jgi:hypothetical protein
MTLIRLLCAIGGLILLAAIVWASLTAGQSLSEAVAWLLSEPWGVVTLTDLYLSFFFVAVLIWCLETNKAVALLFILPLPFLGHVWSAVWMVWRLAALLRARSAPA